MSEKQPEPFGQEREKIDPSVRPGGVFMMQLLMPRPCEMPSKERMAEVLSRHIGRVETAGSAENADLSDNMQVFMAMEHKGKFKEGLLPVQVAIMPCQPFDYRNIDEMNRSQMWYLPDNGERIFADCKYCVFANDILGGALEPLERANFLMDYLEALLELFPTCAAVYFLNSGKLIKAELVTGRKSAGLDRLVNYYLTIRFFNIHNTNDCLVDTLGFSLFYIEDLQYHFHDVEPNFVINHAFNLAKYILHNNCPIKAGDTIDGIEDGQIDPRIQWRCHFEDALVQPKRVVLDICMNEYAAGGRNYK